MFTEMMRSENDWYVLKGFTTRFLVLNSNIEPDHKDVFFLNY